MLVDDYTIRMSTGSTDRSVNLSAAVVNQIVKIKKIDAGTGKVTLSGHTIDGNAAKEIITQYESLTLQCTSAGATFDII
jgi:uncharacterized protein YdgA (DUF945 family)